MKINKHFFKENRILILLIILTFILGFTTAFIIPIDSKMKLVGGLFDKFSGYKGSPQFEFLQILKNNLWVSFLSIALGFTIIAPFGFVFLNGLSIGIVVDLFLRMATINTGYVWIGLSALIPHGVIEIPTLLLTSTISSLIGLKIFFSKYFYKKESRRAVIWQAIKSFVIVIIPLILIAALIEGFVTPLFVKGVEGLGFDSILTTSVNKIDPKLAPLILDADDFRELGIKVENVDLKTQTDNYQKAIESAFVKIIYKDSLLNNYKTYIKSGEGVMRNSYRVVGTSNYISIGVYKFDTAEHAKSSAQFIKEVVTGTVKDTYPNAKLDNYYDYSSSYKEISYNIQVVSQSKSFAALVINSQETKIHRLIDSGVAF